MKVVPHSLYYIKARKIEILKFPDFGFGPNP
jgi:hypothetical protein